MLAILDLSKKQTEKNEYFRQVLSPAKLSVMVIACSRVRKLAMRASDVDQFFRSSRVCQFVFNGKETPR